jgi:SAM-dependent methyltransferase
MMFVCPVCGQEGDHRLVEICNDFRLLHCEACDVVFSEPMKGLDVAQHEQAYACRNVSIRGLSGLTPNARFFLRRRPRPDEALLDVGCGDGFFIKQARGCYDAFGIDIDREAIKAATHKYGIADVAATSVEEFARRHPDRRFDTVTLFEVLEHVEDPSGLVRCIRGLLKPGGALVMSVPNRNRKCAHRDPIDRPPNHLSRWSAQAVEHLLHRNGFRVNRLHQWKTDWFGFFEMEWTIISRLSAVTGPLIRLCQKKRSAFYKNNFIETYDDTVLSTFVRTLVMKTSRLLWFPLYPYFLLARRPSFNLYVEARLEA